ncbi:MAG: hypothetical protein ACRBCL_11510 [Maritimibacter sp.]
MKTILSFVPGVLFIVLGLAIMNVDLIIELINPGAVRTSEPPIDFGLMGIVFTGIGVGFLFLMPLSARKNARKKAAQND